MKNITLKNGEKIMISDRDYPRVSKIQWNKTYISGVTHYEIFGYTSKWANTRTLGRYILNIKSRKLQVFRKDKNWKNFMRSNLLVGTIRQRTVHRSRSYRSKSGLLGVSQTSQKYVRKKTGENVEKLYWSSTIRIDGVNTNLGNFEHTESGKILAAKAYDKAAKKYHGKFANLNFK